MALAPDGSWYGVDDGGHDPDVRNGRLDDATRAVRHRLRIGHVRNVVGHDDRHDAASAAPVLLLFVKINRKNKAAAAPLIPTGLFAMGYLVTWGAFSVMAVALQWQLERARLLSPMLETTNLWLGAGILLAAGLWQLTPMKAACLDHCRTPLGFLTGNWHAGHLGAFRMGVEHGGWCLGCCWFLMALLFFGGVMNLYWIVGLAVFVLMEKIFPFGHWFGRTVGIVLVGWGVLLLVN